MGELSVTFGDLWIPILVSSVIVFFASSLMWMVLPHHKADVKKLPDEDSMMTLLKQMNPPPGSYMWPGCHGVDVKSDEFKQRYNAGPWGSMTVLGGKPNFAKNLISVFIVYIVIGIFVSYVSMHALPEGAHYLKVFQIVGSAAFMAYCLGSLPGAIFFGKPMRFIITELFDGVVYALLTAGTFGWLWPKIADAATGSVPAIPGT